MGLQEFLEPNKVIVKNSLTHGVEDCFHVVRLVTRADGDGCVNAESSSVRRPERSLTLTVPVNVECVIIQLKVQFKLWHRSGTI